MHPGHRAEDVLLVDAELPLDLELVGKDVEQDLGVRLGIDMPQVVDEEVALQVLGIGQIAVMGQHDAVGGIDVEGLGLGGADRPGGGVANMAHTHIAPELDHVAGAKDIPNQPSVFAQVEFVALAGDDPRRILAAVLEHKERVVE